MGARQQREEAADDGAVDDAVDDAEFNIVVRMSTCSACSGRGQFHCC